MKEVNQVDPLNEKLLQVTLMLDIWKNKTPANVTDDFYDANYNEYARIYSKAQKRKGETFDLDVLLKEIDALIVQIQNNLRPIAENLVDDVEKLMKERVIDKDERSQLMQELDSIRAKGETPTRIINPEVHKVIQSLDKMKTLLGIYNKNTDSHVIIGKAFEGSRGENPFKTKGFFDFIARIFSGRHKEIDAIPIDEIVDYLVDKDTNINHVTSILAEKRWFDTGPDFLKKLADNPNQIRRLLEKCSPELAKKFESNEIKLLVKEKDRKKIFDELKVRVQAIKRQEDLDPTSAKIEVIGLSVNNNEEKVGKMVEEKSGGDSSLKAPERDVSGVSSETLLQVQEDKYQGAANEVKGLEMDIKELRSKMEALWDGVESQLKKNRTKLQWDILDNRGIISGDVLEGFIQEKDNSRKMVAEYEKFQSELDAEIERCSDEEKKVHYIVAKEDISDAILELRIDCKTLLLKMRDGLNLKKNTRQQGFPEVLQKVEKELREYENLALPKAKEGAKEVGQRGLIDHLKREASQADVLKTEQKEEKSSASRSPRSK